MTNYHIVVVVDDQIDVLSPWQGHVFADFDEARRAADMTWEWCWGIWERRWWDDVACSGLPTCTYTSYFASPDISNDHEPKGPTAKNHSVAVLVITDRENLLATFFNPRDTVYIRGSLSNF